MKYLSQNDIEEMREIKRKKEEKNRESKNTCIKILKVTWKLAKGYAYQSVPISDVAKELGYDEDMIREKVSNVDSKNVDSKKTDSKYVGYIELSTKTSVQLTDKGVNYVENKLM